MTSTKINTPPETSTSHSSYGLGPWRVEPETGRLHRDGDVVALEPRLMALLDLLVAARGKVIPRSEIEAALWPDVIVGEDTVARAISRLRRALGDSASAPTFVETLPKRGYRLLVRATPPGDDHERHAPRRFAWPLAALCGALVAVTMFIVWPAKSPAPPERATIEVSRADDLYMRFTRADNEAAISLYERVLATDPDNIRAQAGLANALVQRVVRWPDRPDAATRGADTLSEALDRGLTSTSEARAVLQRAESMAERAVRNAPDDTDAMKALAFTATAQGDLERGAELYARAIRLNADAWASMINLGEIRSMQGDVPAALAHFEQAHAAMGRAYAYEPQRVGPWQVAMGVQIGALHEQLGAPAEAELWYRRALNDVPFEPEATVRLARLLAAAGERDEADALCAGLRERVGDYPGCTPAQ
ncbi:MAG: winged helix-turn-helix domain-containing protein [Pseudomonadota bacterium]